jgi:DNA-binding MarR family transcriptional regulator
VSRQDQLLLPQSDFVRLERTTEDIRLQINLRLNLDEVVDVEAQQLREGAARRRPTRGELTRLACKIYDARRARARVLNDELFGEPAWDMLLALYGLPARGEILTVTALNYASDVAQSTGLRWQDRLRDEGLIERGPCEIDARKQMLRLTSKGRDLMEQYLRRLFYCETPVPPHPEAAGG